MSNIIVKGTTPTLRLTCTTDLSGWSYEAAFTTGTRTPLVIKNSRIVCTPTDTGCTIMFTLTQQETLDFRGDTTVLQLRAINTSGTTIGTIHHEFELVEAINDIATSHTSGLTIDHNTAINRDLDDQHPISAITGLTESLAGKQATLVSGTNIKTLNNESLLGSGNIDITSAAWGNITGDIEEQEDLTEKFDTKQDTIDDLATIRTGAAAGATAVQPAAISDMATQTWSKQQVVNNVTSTDTDKPLSANMGKQLSEAVAEKQDALDTQTAYTSKGSATKVAQITTNTLGQVTNIVEVEITKTTLSDLGITATAAELNKLDGVTTTQQQLEYLNSVTSNVQTQLNSKEAADATILKQSNVVNVVTSTATTYPLSANMGKELQDQITNLKARGRYLSVWNCVTGLPTTNPTTLPYTYKTGDYYIIGTVGSPNYKPEGSQYTGAISQTVDTSTIAVNDTYYYDGSAWSLLHGADVSVTFASIAGQPTDNTNLATALNAKQDTLVSGTNIKTINNNSIIGAGNVDIDALPSQTGQSGKYLTTNGTAASWADVVVSNTSFGTFTTDATNTSYTYTHNLGTRALVVQVSNSSYETIGVDVTRGSDNTVTIEFNEAPGVGTYNIYCIARSTTSVVSGEEVYY